MTGRQTIRRARLDQQVLLPRRTCDGQELKRLAGVATSWLEKHAARINALNVFPVPDGDTGTNMLLTMQAAVAEIADDPSHNVGEIARKISQGALMGARGNSGVILSQILRGFARVLEGQERFDARGFAAAMREASTTAYRAVAHAVEGTILTVVREAAAAAEATAQETEDLGVILQRTVDAAEAAVEKTPTLLKTLRDAGVVDAGGLGFQIILEGALRYMRGEAMEVAMPVETRAIGVPDAGTLMSDEVGYGYCTEFVLQGRDLDYEEIRQDLLEMGDSALIVGDEYLIRVHIHTFRPGLVLDYATQHGTLHKIKIDNMQEQYKHFIGSGLDEASVAAAGPALELEQPPAAGEELGGIGVIAVVPGPGLEEVFKSMGASVVIRGGQTMNPSTQELLEAIEAVASDQVIVLPNNKNVHLAAQQAVQMSHKQARIVPTRTVPQGIAALVALNYQSDLDGNVRSMEEAMKDVQTAEITRAVRSVQIGGVQVEEDEVIGLLNGDLVASGDDVNTMVMEMLDRMEAGICEIITLFYGADVSDAEAQALGDRIREAYPDLEIEVVSGGQPYYHYILSAE